MIFALIASLCLAADEPDVKVPVETPQEFEPIGPLRDYVSVGSKVTKPGITTLGSVSVITREQLEMRGYQSVAEALASVAGVQVNYDLVNYNVAVRGALGGARSGSRLLKVMIDGIPLPVAQSEVYYLGPEFLPMSAVERIEILRGPASSLYGAGAYAGAINVVTTQVPYEGETSVTGEVRVYGAADSVSGVGADATTHVKTSTTSLMISASGMSEDRSGLSVPNSSAFSQNFIGTSDDKALPASGLVKVEQRVGGGRLTVLGIGQYHQRDAEFSDLSVLTGNTTNALFNWKSSAAYEKPFGAGFTSTTRFALAGGENLGADQLQPAGEPFLYERSLSYFNTSGATELRYDFTNGASTMVGADLWLDSEQLPSYDEVQGGNSTSRVVGTQQNLRNFAGYGQVLWPLTRGLAVAAGGRVDQHSLFDTQTTGRLAMNIDHNDRIALKLMGGTSFKAASPEQLFNEGPLALDIEGDATLEPQQLFGGEARVEAFVTENLQVSASVFQNKYSNTLGYQLSGGSLVPRGYDADNYGGEVDARMHLPIGDEGFVVSQASLSLQDTLTEDDEKAVFEEKAFPDNEGVARAVTYAQLGGGWQRIKTQLSVEHRYVGNRNPSQSNLALNNSLLMSQPNYQLPGYNLIDIVVSSFPLPIADGSTVRAMVKVQNMLDQRFAEVGYNGVDVPGLGRRFMFRADVRY